MRWEKLLLPSCSRQPLFSTDFPGSSSEEAMRLLRALKSAPGDRDPATRSLASGQPQEMAGRAILQRERESRIDRVSRHQKPQPTAIGARRARVMAFWVRPEVPWTGAEKPRTKPRPDAKSSSGPAGHMSCVGRSVGCCVPRDLHLCVVLPPGLRNLAQLISLGYARSIASFDLAPCTCILPSIVSLAA